MKFNIGDVVALRGETKALTVLSEEFQKDGTQTVLVVWFTDRCEVKQATFPATVLKKKAVK